MAVRQAYWWRRGCLTVSNVAFGHKWPRCCASGWRYRKRRSSLSSHERSFAVIEPITRLRSSLLRNCRSTLSGQLLSGGAGCQI